MKKFTIHIIAITLLTLPCWLVAQIPDGCYAPANNGSLIVNGIIRKGDSMIDLTAQSKGLQLLVISDQNGHWHKIYKLIKTKDKP